MAIITSSFITLFLSLFLTLSASAADGTLAMEVELGPGTGDCPMIMVWLETTNGDFVRTLQTFSKDKKYFKDLTIWWDYHQKTPADVLDAVIGPTIKWNTSKSANVPMVLNGVNLLDGKYQIHIEQRRDKGGHYKKMCIPLPPTFSSGTVKGEGYISQIKFTVKK